MSLKDYLEIEVPNVTTKLRSEGKKSACSSIMWDFNVAVPRWKNSTLKITHSTKYHGRINMGNKTRLTFG